MLVNILAKNKCYIYSYANLIVNRQISYTLNLCYGQYIFYLCYKYFTKHHDNINAEYTSKYNFEIVNRNNEYIQIIYFVNKKGTATLPQIFSDLIDLTSDLYSGIKRSILFAVKSSYQLKISLHSHNTKFHNFDQRKGIIRRLRK